MSERPSDPLRVLGGILLLLFGICLVFAGGACTLFVLENAYSDGGVMLLVGLGTLGLGVLSLAAAWRALRPPLDG